MRRASASGERAARRPLSSGAPLSGGKRWLTPCCVGLHPGVVAGGNILDAQLVGGGQQGGEAGVVAAAQSSARLGSASAAALQRRCTRCQAPWRPPCGVQPRALCQRPAGPQRRPRRSPAAAKCGPPRRSPRAVQAHKHLVLLFRRCRTRCRAENASLIVPVSRHVPGFGRRPAGRSVRSPGGLRGP